MAWQTVMQNCDVIKQMAGAAEQQQHLILAAAIDTNSLVPLCILLHAIH